LDLIIKDIKIPVELDNDENYLKACLIELQNSTENISIVKILSKEIDLRNCKQFNYILTLAVKVPNSFDNSKNFQEYIETAELFKKNVNIKDRPIIIGFGPAGMFAALELISYGLKPVIFERGKKIEDRSLDVKQFILEGQLNHDSNIQFGEGGAGYFSDGKNF
jgi:uncharacterized FAD-dependent dehydrogenase